MRVTTWVNCPHSVASDLFFYSEWMQELLYFLLHRFYTFVPGNKTFKKKLVVMHWHGLLDTFMTEAYSSQNNVII
jgi:hypothetical protein